MGSTFFSLLKQTEPIREAYDVEWWGPYYIPRSGRWLPTHFKLYQGVLYGTVEMGLSLATGQWPMTPELKNCAARISSRSAPASASCLWPNSGPSARKPKPIFAGTPSPGSGQSRKTNSAGWSMSCGPVHRQGGNRWSLHLFIPGTGNPFGRDRPPGRGRDHRSGHGD